MSVELHRIWEVCNKAQDGMNTADWSDGFVAMTRITTAAVIWSYDFKCLWELNEYRALMLLHLSNNPVCLTSHICTLLSIHFIQIRIGGMLQVLRPQRRKIFGMKTTCTTTEATALFLECHYMYARANIFPALSTWKQIIKCTCTCR